MFHKTIEALKATEAAIKEELDALWVPYDKETGNGGLHWHAAGAGILQNAQRGVTGLREELEKRQGPIDEADAAAKKAEEDAAKADAEQKEREAAAAAEEVDATPTALEHAQSVGVDISKIKGTGKDGRVTKRDVDAAVAEQEAVNA